MVGFGVSRLLRQIFSVGSPSTDLIFLHSILVFWLILLIFPTMAEKASGFSSFLVGTPMITSNRLKGSDNYQSWANSITFWFTGNGVKVHLTSTESSVTANKRPQCRKHDALLCNILQHPSSPKHSTTLGTIRHVSLFGPKLRIYIPMMFNASTLSSLPLIVWSSLVWNYLPSLGECLH